MENWQFDEQNGRGCYNDNELRNNDVIIEILYIIEWTKNAYILTTPAAGQKFILSIAGK